jgi:diguanylate cyclase (GGDEF)-like protein
MKVPEVAKVLGEMTGVFDEMLASLSTLQCLSDLEVHKADEKTLLVDALATLLENYGVERSAVFFCKEQSVVKAVELDWAHWQGKNENASPANTGTSALSHIEQHFAQLTLENGKPQFCPNYLSDPHLLSLLGNDDPLPAGCLLTAPIRSGGESIGVIVMSHPENDYFNEWHHRLLVLYSNFLGQILTANRLMKHLEVEVKGRTQQLEEVLDETRHLKQHYETLAMVDELTGLYNRRFFFTESKLALSRALRFTHSYSLILMDIDRFKQVNDEFGHAIGDIVLQDVAKALLDILRETDVLARVGGEEFAVVLPDTSENGAKILAERLRAAASNLEWTIGERKLHITLSLGVTTLPSPEEQSENSARIDPRAFHDHLYTVADNAMYSAKTAGGDRFIFQPSPIS